MENEKYDNICPKCKSQKYQTEINGNFVKNKCDDCNHLWWQQYSEHKPERDNVK